MSATAYLTVLVYVLAFAAMAKAALVDVRERIIPNELVLVVAGAGLALRLFEFDGLGLILSLAVAFGILVLLGQLSRLNIVGGGDAKLIAAASLLFPSSAVPTVVAYIALAGGLVALVYLLKGIASRARFAGRENVAPASPHGNSLPYGVAILLGTLSFQFLEVIRQCSTAESCLS